MPGLWTCRMWPIRGRTCVYVSKFLIIYLLMISAVISQRLHHRFMKTAESDIFLTSFSMNSPYNCINLSNRDVVEVHIYLFLLKIVVSCLFFISDTFKKLSTRTQCSWETTEFGTMQVCCFLFSHNFPKFISNKRATL